MPGLNAFVTNECTSLAGRTEGDPPVRILTVANHVGSKGGLERAQLEICRGLLERGHDVVLLYVNGGDFVQEWRCAGATLVPIPTTLPRRERPASSSVGFLKSLARGVQARPHVIYIHRHWDVPYALSLKRIVHRRVVCHLHLPPPRDLPVWLTSRLSTVDKFVAVSQHAANEWERVAVTKRAPTVAYNGVDSARFRPATTAERCLARESLGLSNELVILYVGRIDPGKGVETLLAAFKRLRSEVAVELIFVGGASVGGDGSYCMNFIDQAMRAGAKYVAPEKDIRRFYWAADVVAVPSVIAEAQGLVVLEALASGVPVVASRTGGIPEMLAGDLGIGLVAPGDAAELAQRLREVLYLDGVRDLLSGRHVRDAVVGTFGWSRTVDLVEGALRENAWSN